MTGQLWTQARQMALRQGHPGQHLDTSTRSSRGFRPGMVTVPDAHPSWPAADPLLICFQGMGCAQERILQQSVQALEQWP